MKNSIKSIVLVKVKQMNEVTSPLYDLGHTEEELKTKWKKYYNQKRKFNYYKHKLKN